MISYFEAHVRGKNPIMQKQKQIHAFSALYSTTYITTDACMYHTVHISSAYIETSIALTLRLFFFMFHSVPSSAVASTELNPISDRLLLH